MFGRLERSQRPFNGRHPVYKRSDFLFCLKLLRNEKNRTWGVTSRAEGGEGGLYSTLWGTIRSIGLFSTPRIRCLPQTLADNGTWMWETAVDGEGCGRPAGKLEALGEGGRCSPEMPHPPIWPPLLLLLLSRFSRVRLCAIL